MEEAEELHETSSGSIRFNSWVAGAMGVKFLAQGNNNSRKPQLGIEPGTLQSLGRFSDSLLLPSSGFCTAGRFAIVC